MKIRTLTSEVVLIFDADEPAALTVFGRDNADAFGQEYGFAQVGELEAEGSRAPLWGAFRGQLKRPEGKPIRIEQVRGSATDMVVQVDGGSPEALYALDAVWRSLCKLHGVTITSPEDLGTRMFNTVAVVELQVTFEALFPAAKTLRDAVVSRLERGPFSLRERVQHRYGFDLSVSVGHRRIPRRVTVEPRATATDEHVFWTQSPLPSEEHLAMLEALEKQ